MIGHLAGGTGEYGPLKFKVDSVAKLFLTFIVSKKLKHFYTLNNVLKRAIDLKTISN